MHCHIPTKESHTPTLLECFTEYINDIYYIIYIHLSIQIYTVHRLCIQCETHFYTSVSLHHIERREALEICRKCIYTYACTIDKAIYYIISIYFGSKSYIILYGLCMAHIIKILSFRTGMRNVFHRA